MKEKNSDVEASGDFASVSVALGRIGVGRNCLPDALCCNRFPLPLHLLFCGDESHNSDYIRTPLTSTLVEGPGLTVDFTEQEKLVSYDNLKN